MNATRKSALTAAVFTPLLLAFGVVPLGAQTAGVGSQPRALPKPDQAVGERYRLAAPAPARSSMTDTATRLLGEAQMALAVGDLKRCETLLGRVDALGLPEGVLATLEPNATALAWQVQQRRLRIDPAVQTTAAEMPTDGPAAARQALHVPENDATLNRPAAALVGPSLGANAAVDRAITRQPAPPRMAPAPPRVASAPARMAQLPPPAERVYAEPRAASAPRLLAEGEQLLREGDLDGALERFQAANARRSELGSAAQGRLADHLRILGASAPATPPSGVATVDSMIDDASEEQQVLARQLATEVMRTQSEARGMRESEPRKALEMLEAVATKVEKSGLAKQYRDQLGRRVTRSIDETKGYIEANRAQIELDERNAEILAEIDLENAAAQRKRESVATMIDKYNSLRDEYRFEEAMVVAQRLIEIAPDDPIAQQLYTSAQFFRRNRLNQELLRKKDDDLWHLDYDMLRASSPDVNDENPIVFGDPKDWEGIRERGSLSENRRVRSPREIDIARRLKTPVQLRFTDRPLGEVIDTLSQMTGVNIYLDPRGLNQEGVSSDTPVTINLREEVMLESALNLILTPLHLGHTITDEVLKVTSETMRDGELTREVYYVADLVIPIPNFVPSNNIGLQGLINDALAVTGYGAGGLGAPGPVALANGGPNPGGATPAGDVLAQQLSPGGLGGPAGSSPIPLTSGPGGLGGAAAADFDSLIELITSTVAADSWAENGGGDAEIRPYQVGLSLVVSQTQAVHEEISDLLDQLRKLQDLQVTIEVRFIRLSDDFFERIGIDFDMNINDRILGTDEIVQTDVGVSSGEVVPTGVARTSGNATVGVQAPLVGDLATLTADLDIPFRQGSFPVAQPTIGGFNPASAATFGFAILSDIEAYFLINAAQGDSRTNVLNAPKVTLFNGQQAFVSDTSQSPFVISVVPVVGEFAAAQQPVIVVLSEGTLMSIQAVVSDDRRYVRLTVVPFFSEIGDIDTFTFDGTTTTNNTTSSSATDGDDDGTNESADNAQTQQQTIAGTTVQLPTFQFVSVTTTVSVPDGGTVLLGGIKRLAEGREEFGVPLLSKIPYINRLFRNVGIGRETDSLMMMVTPRIIIQEEEEQRLGLAGN